ncbi:MAG: alpha/beta hydrolase [Gemmataceae bacterium]|nr:alpha/beta hydrolase [Gemmataceae bacterium]
MRCSRWLGLVLLTGSGCLAPSGEPRTPLASVERALLFHPERYPAGDWQPSDLVYEDAWFQSADGTRLHGWYCPAEQPRAVVLYCHGNAGNVTGCKWALRLLQEKCGVSVLAFDYRGYGRSDGSPTEVGILADARAARRWLAARTGAFESDIVLLGRSLGGAVAIDLAARDGARGLILENTFTSLRDVAAGKTWPLPPELLMQARLDSVGKIGAYAGPLLQAHGDADRVVPYDLGVKLFEAANRPKRFVRVPGGGHNDPPSAEYYQALVQFLASLPAAGDWPWQVGKGPPPTTNGAPRAAHRDAGR